MRRAAAAEEFERAARLRDQLEAARLAGEHQEVVGAADEDFDVMGIAEAELEAAVQVFHVRHGRVVGRQGFVVERSRTSAPPSSSPGCSASTTPRRRSACHERSSCRRCPPKPRPTRSGSRGRRGATVVVRVPRRGHKRALVGVAEQNAAEQLVRHRIRRASDHAARARALEELQRHLGLAEAPLRIECYDMSHLQGTDYVGSMVVIEDGLPKRGDYRRFKVTGVAGNDDYAAMEEVLTRRLRRLAEPAAPGDDEAVTRRRRVRLPAAAAAARRRQGPARRGRAGARCPRARADRVAVAALAKQFEEVFVPGSADPVRIPRDSEAIYLLQRIRDEAHRFAISYHRELRARRLAPRSPRGRARPRHDAAPARLLAEFGSLRALRAASAEDLLTRQLAPGRRRRRRPRQAPPRRRPVPGPPPRAAAPRVAP